MKGYFLTKEVVTSMVKKFGRSIVNFAGIKLGVLIYDLRQKIAVTTLPRFANEPKNLFIDFPRRIANPEKITMGDNVSLGPGTLLSAITHYPTAWMKYKKNDPPKQTFDPRIVIGSRVTATADLQIAAVKGIVIEDDVMFASNVHINDSLHGFDNANIPFKYQPLGRIAPIWIKYGSWLGQNTVVLPGVTIGPLSIIGANSIVNRDIPGRCIAVGSPARIIRHWSEEKQEWVDGNRQ